MIFALISGHTFAADQRKLVVVLYPEDTDGSPGTIGADRGIRSILATSSKGYVEVRNEYVDTTRNRDSDIKRNQREYLRQKYANRKVDLVITVLSSALDFALDHRDEIFPGVPVVFTGVDDREIKSRKLPRDMIGSPTRVEVEATLDVALRLHPGTKRVYVISGSAPFDREWLAEAQRIFRKCDSSLEFVYYDGLPFDDLLTRVQDLPAQSIIYYLHIFQDGSGKTFVPAEAVQMIGRVANAPIYGYAESYIGRGPVGGKVINLEDDGRKSAHIGLRILAGESPDSIPREESSENKFVFDWRQLHRWSIRESQLPEGSIVRFRELSFWDQYKWYILGGITMLVLESLLVAGLFVQLAKKRRAEARFRQVIETAPIGMLMIGREGTIVMTNQRVREFFGYDNAELLGMPVELLIPERVRELHVRNRRSYSHAPEVRQMGIGRELYGRRKDGSEFPVEIGLSPLQTPHGLFVLASVIDHTIRRKAEDDLRTSQRELQLLTGRLFEAQESERRRIARELHDDFNQNLALLSVELDLLANAPHQNPSETSERIRALSGRVREISSSVHELSHQLHPSKLEQLGLVIAIRSLCKEWSQGHGLEVTFTIQDEPGPVPPESALCLYRIVQEALRNIVKHSGSHQAKVELAGSPESIRLQILDEGCGFDTTAITSGLGLISMRERLNLIGGEIAIHSMQRGGTRIDVQVPIVQRIGAPASGPNVSAETENVR